MGLKNQEEGLWLCHGCRISFLKKTSNSRGCGGGEVTMFQDLNSLMASWTSWRRELSTLQLYVLKCF
ncbi:hypothetical protein LDENG_00264310 [Lucifuga dentata]|nr:hypothetical protein LDENG_00264310 [Lucifuga dentata]